MSWSEVPIDTETEDKLLVTTAERKKLVVTGSSTTFIGVSNADKWREIEVNG